MKRFINGREVELDVPQDVSISALWDRLMVRTTTGSASATVVRQGDVTHISYRGRQFLVEKALTRARGAAGVGTGEIHAPMPGQIVDVLVSEGANVMKGDRLVVLEAMKTQQPFLAPFDGTVKQLLVQKGQQIAEGALLALILPLEE